MELFTPETLLENTLTLWSFPPPPNQSVCHGSVVYGQQPTVLPLVSFASGAFHSSEAPSDSAPVHSTGFLCRGNGARVTKQSSIAHLISFFTSLFFYFLFFLYLSRAKVSVTVPGYVTVPGCLCQSICHSTRVCHCARLSVPRYLSQYQGMSQCQAVCAKVSVTVPGLSLIHI